jgi:hypothetical protein
MSQDIEKYDVTSFCHEPVKDKFGKDIYDPKVRRFIVNKYCGDNPGVSSLDFFTAVTGKNEKNMKPLVVNHYEFFDSLTIMPGHVLCSIMPIDHKLGLPECVELMGLLPVGKKYRSGFCKKPTELLMHLFEDDPAIKMMKKLAIFELANSEPLKPDAIRMRDLCKVEIDNFQTRMLAITEGGSRQENETASIYCDI